MHKLTNALIVGLVLALSAGTVVLDRHAIGGAWTWGTYAWDFAICAACYYVLARIMTTLIVMGIQTRARIRELQAAIDARQA